LNIKLLRFLEAWKGRIKLIKRGLKHFSHDYLNKAYRLIFTVLGKAIHLILHILTKILPKKHHQEIDRFKMIFNQKYESIFFFWQKHAYSYDKEEFARINKKTKNDFIKIAITSFLINLMSLAMPLMMLQTYDRILPNKGIPTLTLLTFGLLTIISMEVALKIIRSKIASLTSAVFEHYTSCEAIKNLMSANYKDIQETGSGVFLKRMQAISRLRGFYSGQTLMSIIDLPFTFIYLIVIWYVGKELVLVPLIVCSIYTIFVIKTGYILKHITKERDQFNNYKTENLVQVLEGIHTVKSLGAETFFIRKNKNIRSQQSSVLFKIGETNNLINNLGAIFSQLMTIVVVVFGCIVVHNGVMGMGGLVACVMLSGRLMQPIQKILSLWTRFQDFYSAQKEVKNLFDYKIPDHESLPEDWTFKGSFEIKNLHFSIDEEIVKEENSTQNRKPKKLKVVDGINLKMKIGECIGISEQHGIGKTTLLHLLAGFYKPDSGQILIDDIDINKIPLNQLYQHIGLISENGEILKGTILENLTFFGQISWEDVEPVADLLKITEAVAVLPSGWETNLFNSPADVIPPGLKQRICIARTLAQKPEIIFFDNADVSLDIEGYQSLFSILGKIKKRTIIIMVTQDRNFMEIADKEFHFIEGKLVPYNGQQKVDLTA